MSLFYQCLQLIKSNAHLQVMIDTIVVADNMNDCNSNRFKIRFIDKNDSFKLKYPTPPYPISYQASGNTYSRLIIELITGFFTQDQVFQSINIY